MTKTVEIKTELEDLLNEELTDPNNERRDRGGNIVKKNSKPITDNEFPRIIVSLLDNQKTGFSVGATDRFHRHRIQVSVQVGDSNEFKINGELRGSGYTKNWLAERCDEIVQENQSRFRNLGDDIYSVLPDSSNPASPGNTRQTSNDYILRRRRG